MTTFADIFAPSREDRLKRLVKCRESTVQEYGCCVVKNGISFDACLAKELFWLWDQGIVTIGSCCGKHVNSPSNSSYISVDKKQIQIMKILGYKVRTNNLHPEREDSFIPKTV